MPSIAPSTRLNSIDILRGLAIALMALDHTRDFFSASQFDPRNVYEPALFLTRWITHICAPAFIFLSGVAIYFWRQKHGLSETRRFVFRRGVLLIVLEFTLVRFGWTFDFSSGLFLAQVIWVIGWCMIVLSGLMHCSLNTMLAISVLTIVGHNLLDPIQAEQLGGFAIGWQFLHQPSMINLGEQTRLFMLYPLVPWFAVMSLGYCFGRVMRLAPDRRRRILWQMGAGALVAFLLLRGINIYGDPQPWRVEGDWLATALSFINCEKYPPSLSFLLMTLGLSLVFLAMLEGRQYRILNIFRNLGQVPLFFYLLHLPVIHLMAVGVTMLRGQEVAWLFEDPFFAKPDSYGDQLAMIYGFWLVAMLMLYPMCAWYRGYKHAHRYPWMKYL